MISTWLHRIRRRLRDAASLCSRRKQASVASRYFVHIPKTGGMTVHAFLRACEQADQGSIRLFPGFFLHEVIADLEAARRCDMFSGHFLGFLDPLLRQTTRKAVVLRDPVERAVSHFLHVKRDPLLSYHDAFRSLSLSEVLADPSLRSFAENVQARYLAALVDDSAWLDHTMHLRHLYRKDCDSHTLLDRARAGLSTIEVVGSMRLWPSF